MKVTKNARLTILLFVIPALVIYVWWVIYPIISAVYMSFFQTETLHSSHFAGFSNYLRVFKAALFWKSMRVSLIFILFTTILQVFFGFLFGYLVYLQQPGYRFYKALLFMPTILPSVATGFIWSYIYSPSMGVLKPFMKAIGLGKYYASPIADPKLALYAVIFAQLWAGVGTQIILFNSVQSMIIPLSWDVIKMVIILQTIGALRSFDLVYVMTSGGPNHSTEVMPMHLFVNAFQNFNLGYGNVVAVILFLMAMILTVTMRRLMQRDSLY